MRWLALAWLALYLPAYASAYGGWHFLMLCNLGVLLTCAGLALGSQWLLSSQAVAAPPIALLWLVDAGARLLTGEHLHGGTAYMWETERPLLVRMLSLYHLAWPLLLLWCLHRRGYDPRGWLLQAALAAAVFAIGLLLAPAAENLNYVIQWPGSPRPHPQPMLQAVASLGILLMGVYWPMHLILRRSFRPPGQAPAAD